MNTIYNNYHDINGMIMRIHDYALRMVKEPPYANFEMQGRLMSVFGSICIASAGVYNLRTQSQSPHLNNPASLDYIRMIALLDASRSALKRILDRLPLFRYRNYNAYPSITSFDEVMQVYHEFLPLQQLPFSDKDQITDVNLNATAFAYKMYDITFLGLAGMIRLLEQMDADAQMFQSHPGLHDTLTNLCLPATRANIDLFTSRAAEELATLLVPVIAQNVDFRHRYHYAAWAMAMRDLGLIDKKKRNGLLIMNFINRHFLKEYEKIAVQNLLTEIINKNDYDKVKAPYWHCLSILNQILQRHLPSLGIPEAFHHPHPNTPTIPITDRLHLLQLAIHSTFTQ